MGIECSECRAETYEAVDSETDVKGRRFVLLSCKKCRRTIIVPAAQWHDSAEGVPNTPKKS